MYFCIGGVISVLGIIFYVSKNICQNFQIDRTKHVQCHSGSFAVKVSFHVDIWTYNTHVRWTSVTFVTYIGLHFDRFSFLHAKLESYKEVIMQLMDWLAGWSVLQNLWSKLLLPSVTDCKEIWCTKCRSWCNWNFVKQLCLQSSELFALGHMQTPVAVWGGN